MAGLAVYVGRNSGNSEATHAVNVTKRPNLRRLGSLAKYSGRWKERRRSSEQHVAARGASLCSPRVKSCSQQQPWRILIPLIQMFCTNACTIPEIPLLEMSNEPLLSESDRRCLNHDVDANCEIVSSPQNRCGLVGDEESPQSTSGTEDMAVHSGLRSWWLVRWGRVKILDPLYLIVSRGTEPKTLAFSAALGLTLGIFPIYGVTVILCACAAVLLGSHCHTPTLMLANLLATPIEISLIVPFLRTGEWLTGGRHLLLSKSALWNAVTGRASKEVLLGLLHALVGWIVFAPLVLFALYVVLVPVMKYATRRFGSDNVRHQLASQRQGLLRSTDISDSLKVAVV